MIKIIFLGTNGWYDTKTGNTASILIQTPKHDIILDAGNGFTKIGKYISFNKPVYLFLSHYHLDHIIGLHTLNKFNFRKSLHIAGPKGLKKMFKTIIRKPYTFPFSKLPYPTKVYELNEGQHKLPLPFECRILTHPVTTFGYRFKLDGKIIAYCTDTGYCENAIWLAKNSNLLIAECSYKRGMKVSEWPHLNPDDAGRLAKKSGTKKLVLTHFDASLYKTIPERRKAQNQARKTFYNTTAAMDEIIIEI